MYEKIKQKSNLPETNEINIEGIALAPSFKINDTIERSKNGSQAIAADNNARIPRNGWQITSCTLWVKVSDLRHAYTLPQRTP